MAIMVRWRIVLHHGIDGFSPLVVFGACSTNNKAHTVLQLYLEAVRKYGRPFRVRTDHGGENVEVWRDMNQSWGEEARPVIVEVQFTTKELNATIATPMSRYYRFSERSSINWRGMGYWIL